MGYLGEVFLFYHETVCWMYALESHAIRMSTLNIPLFLQMSKKHPKIVPIGPPGLALWLTHDGSHNPCLEQISMFPRMIQPLKCDCMYIFDNLKLLKTITKTCLYNFDPLTTHFYIVKLGFIGVHIIFLIETWNISDFFIWIFSFFGGKIFGIFG